MTPSAYTPSQRRALLKFASLLPTQKAFTVTGADGGDVRNPKSPKYKWTGAWSDPIKYKALLSIEEAFAILDSDPTLRRIALCFYPNCGYGGIDYDGCSSDLSTATAEQIHAFNTMPINTPTEISRSGNGIHQFFIGNATTEKDNGHLELFGIWGYICLTGDFKEIVDEIPEIDDEIINTIREIIKPTPKERSQKIQTAVIKHNESPGSVIALLNNCNPNVSYGDWVNICFAFRSSYVLDDGYEQFEKFSQGGTTYDPLSTRTLWDSYNPEKSNYSIGTLVYEANKHKGLPDEFRGQTKSVASTLNDAGNAERFVTQFKGKYLFVPELKTWLHWKDNYWQADAKDRIKQAAIKVSKSIFHEAAQADPQIAPKIAAWANASLQKSHIDAMIELSKSYLSASVHELDNDPMMLGVRNGVINLRNGAFREAQPSDLITQQCDVTYIPNAQAPLWEKFLYQVSNNDPKLLVYKQEYWGYALTGVTSEQCFFYYHGDGLNGKSTEIGLMQTLMGSYAKSIPSSVLMVRSNFGSQGPTPEIARLIGARLVTANETEDGSRLAEAQIKAMTGQDMLTARVLHGNPFEFRPKFKIFVSGNHKPLIRGEDDGIWRRIKVVPFNTQIPESEVDKQLLEKLLAERSGILNWAIQGCLLWQQNGRLSEPEVVKSEVATYRSDQDVMGAWIAERCQFDASKTCSSRDLYSDYSEWVKSSGGTPVAETRFSTRLIERGLTKRRVKQKMTFFGVDLIKFSH